MTHLLQNQNRLLALVPVLLERRSEGGGRKEKREANMKAKKRRNRGRKRRRKSENQTVVPACILCIGLVQIMSDVCT